MIPEHTQYTAVPIGGEEKVKGYLVPMWGQLHIINPEDENTATPIQPDTIEPVRVKPNYIHASSAYPVVSCPACGEDICKEFNDYCHRCGQALDWDK